MHFTEFTRTSFDPLVSGIDDQVTEKIDIDVLKLFYNYLLKYYPGKIAPYVKGSVKINQDLSPVEVLMTLYNSLELDSEKYENIFLNLYEKEIHIAEDIPKYDYFKNGFIDLKLFYDRRKNKELFEVFSFLFTCIYPYITFLPSYHSYGDSFDNSIDIYLEMRTGEEASNYSEWPKKIKDLKNFDYSKIKKDKEAQQLHANHQEEIEVLTDYYSLAKRYFAIVLPFMNAMRNSKKKFTQKQAIKVLTKNSEQQFIPFCEAVFEFLENPHSTNSFNSFEGLEYEMFEDGYPIAYSMYNVFIWGRESELTTFYENNITESYYANAVDTPPSVLRSITKPLNKEYDFESSLDGLKRINKLMQSTNDIR